MRYVNTRKSITHIVIIEIIEIRKSGLLQTRETQTSIDKESQEISSPPHQPFPKPHMDTAPLATHIPQPTSADNTQSAPRNNQTPTGFEYLREGNRLLFVLFSQSTIAFQIWTIIFII